LPSPVERAILVGLDLKRPSRKGAPAEPIPETTSAEESLDELAVLAESAGAEVVARNLQSRPCAEAATLVGAGKVEQLAEQAEAFHADVVLFDRDLTPTQLRNLEKALPCKVLDRTQLILDIFARRARTREGQLQVELAQLNYLLPRLTGRGAAMSRLGGGIGTRGPGETQLETDRRRIFRRIRKIETDLASVRSHRSVQRRQRQAVPLATVALVGYTNAGKSTLFNRLTGAGVLADQRMFATLDPTVRQVVLPSRRRALLSDTVGFIRQLPTTLVEAFRATLEEVTEAALLLHVVDASSLHAQAESAHVATVLAEIGAGSTPQLLVLNKSDLTGPDFDPSPLTARVLEASPATPPQVALVSARTGDGVEGLLELIDRMLPVDPIVTARFRFPHDEAGKLHLLHEHARVLESNWDAGACDVTAEVPESVLRRLTEFQVR
jgi:GTP-binding protein HflX